MLLLQNNERRKALEKESLNLKNGDHCLVIFGTHKGKSGVVQDLKWSKTGHITITVLQADGERFKTLGRNVEVVRGD